MKLAFQKDNSNVYLSRILRALAITTILSVPFSTVTHAQTDSVKLASVEANDDATAEALAAANEIAADKPVLTPAQIEFETALKTFVESARDSIDRDDREGIARYYADNGLAPIWLDNGKLNSDARKVIFKISRSDRYGLEPSDYNLKDLSPSTTNAAEGIDLDLKMSLTAVRFARHLNSGRFVPQKISASLDMNPERLDAENTIATLVDADDAGKAIEDFHPRHPEYHALLRELDRLEEEAAEPKIIIEPGKLIRPGGKDARVPLLRQRLKVDMPEPAEVAVDETAPEIDLEVYDEALVAAVKQFQKDNRLTQDGIVGPNTVRVLNGGSDIDLRSKVLVNLERWRWMPKELGKFHIFANIPEYQVFVRDNYEVIHNTRVVVGKRKHMTVAFSDEMEHFVVNPSWGVPQSIIKNEMLPAARRNPGYFNAKGYQVYARINGRVRRIDPSRVNWNGVNPTRISVRQPPGARNALGQIKFMFPNKHSIYMHDTPSKSLFNRDTRAFSHGCVRIHNPMEFADAILTKEPEWNAARVQKMVGGRESTIKLNQTIPVHIGYFTAAVAENGDVKFHADVYGHDRKMIAAMNL